MDPAILRDDLSGVVTSALEKVSADLGTVSETVSEIVAGLRSIHSHVQEIPAAYQPFFDFALRVQELLDRAESDGLLNLSQKDLLFSSTHRVNILRFMEDLTQASAAFFGSKDADQPN